MITYVCTRKHGHVRTCMCTWASSDPHVWAHIAVYMMLIWAYHTEPIVSLQLTNKKEHVFTYAYEQAQSFPHGWVCISAASPCVKIHITAIMLWLCLHANVCLSLFMHTAVYVHISTIMLTRVCTHKHDHAHRCTYKRCDHAHTCMSKSCSHVYAQALSYSHLRIHTAAISTHVYVNVSGKYEFDHAHSCMHT